VIEQELRALAAYVELPPERDLTHAVRARLRVPARRRRRRALVIALAAALLALAVAFAVPPARSAILRFLHLQGVRIELADELPQVRASGATDLGYAVPLADAERTAGFRPLTSALLGTPDGVTFDGEMLWFRYGRVRLLVSQFRGSERAELIKKVVEPDTQIYPVSIRGRRGYFITGARHFLYLAPGDVVRQERVRLARDVLLWQSGPLTLRLEGDLTISKALQIARSFR
jgi:hypothetical protein